MSTNDSTKLDVDKEVGLDETLLTDLVVSGLPPEEKPWKGNSPDEPTATVAKDMGPPDGGYGWVVVAYCLYLSPR